MPTKRRRTITAIFPDPDLLPLEVSEELADRERAKLPELHRNPARRCALHQRILSLRV